MYQIALILYFICIKRLFGASSGVSSPIVIPIPFTDKNITIPNDLVFSRINGTFVLTIIQLFWWYIIGRFIVKDIISYIDRLKSGEIISHTDTNIKADML